MADNKFDLGRRIRPLDDWAIRLFAPALPGGDGKEPFLYLDFQYTINGKSSNEKFANIEIGVNLRKPGKEGKIIFRPSLLQFNMFCQAIKDAADGLLPDGMIKIDSMSSFINGQKLNQAQTEHLIVIGKDEEGVFTGVTQQGRDNVKFYFTPPKMTQLRTRNGEVLTNGYASRLSALSRVKIWEEHINYIVMTASMDEVELQRAKEEKKQANNRAFAQRQNGGGQGGGNRGNYNNNQNGGNGNGGQTFQSTAPAPTGGQTFDDDMPW